MTFRIFTTVLALGVLLASPAMADGGNHNGGVSAGSRVGDPHNDTDRDHSRSNNGRVIASTGVGAGVDVTSGGHKGGSATDSPAGSRAAEANRSFGGHGQY